VTEPSESLATNLRITDALIRYAMLLQQIADLGLTLPKRETK
jgi:hypothetical protein